MLHSPLKANAGSGGILQSPQRSSFVSSSHEEMSGSPAVMNQNGTSRGQVLNVAVSDGTQVREDHPLRRQGNDHNDSRYSITTLTERANEKLQAALNVLPEIARAYLSEEEEDCGGERRRTSLSSENAAVQAATGRSSPTINEKVYPTAFISPHTSHSSLPSPHFSSLDHKGVTKQLKGIQKVSSSLPYSATAAQKTPSPSSSSSLLGLPGSSPTVPKGGISSQPTSRLSSPPVSLTHSPTTFTSPKVFSIAPGEVRQESKKVLDSTISSSLDTVTDSPVLISWKCGLCGYHVLAVDQFGKPLPLSCNAYGDCIPLRCPRCHLEHTSWEASTPFDRQGEHVNMRSTLASHQQLLNAPRHLDRATAPSLPGTSTGATTVASTPALVGEGAQPSSSTIGSTTGSSTSLLQGKDAAHPTIQPCHASLPSSSPSRVELPPILAAIGKKRHINREVGQNYPHAMGSLSSNYPRNTPIKGMGAFSLGSRKAFYCGLCGRRLLRVDSDGELVAMDLDDEGQVRPLRCPGCQEVHSKWLIKPFVSDEGKVKLHGTNIHSNSSSDR